MLLDNEAKIFEISELFAVFTLLEYEKILSDDQNQTCGAVSNIFIENQENCDIISPKTCGSFFPPE